MRRSILVVSSLLLMAACGASTPDPISPPPPPPPPPPANSVLVSSNQFSPAQLTTSSGSTVTWTWQGGIHNLTFEDNVGNAADMTSGTHARTFNAAATFRYRCTNHSSNFTSGMSGSVVVQ